MCGRMDLRSYSSSLHAHDFTPGKGSRVVMIRKKEQRTFIASSTGQEPMLETLTKETVQTFRGNKVERKITSQKRGDPRVSRPDLIEGFTCISIQNDESKSKKSSTTTVSSLLEGSPSGGASRKVSAGKKRSEPSVAGDKFAEECLAAHNSYRERHKCPPLRLTKKLCKYSEEWARHLAARGEMEHRSDSAYGENLFQIWSPGTALTGAEPVHYWYSEFKDHVFFEEPHTLKTGHFTQVVWLESEELGVGVAKSRTGQLFVVANYHPPGNFIGSFAENVPPLGGFTKLPKSLASEVKNDPDFLKEMVQVHNEYRAKHGSPPVTINSELNDLAQEWAVKLARENKFEHRPRNPHGENIMSMTSTNVATAKDACAMWYSESKGYQYGTEPKALSAGHFTQMIWRESVEIGAGRAKGKAGQVVIVVNYKPRGNIIGQFSSNIQRPVQ